MSSDVYFDFHSPEAYPLHCKMHSDGGDVFGNWRRLVTRMGHYKPVRVSYLSNLIAGCTFEDWETLQKRWNGTLLSSENVNLILRDWCYIWNKTQDPKNKTDCVMPHDIVGAVQLGKILLDNLGNHVTFRVD